jgi:hypothetical protein
MGKLWERGNIEQIGRFPGEQIMTIYLHCEGPTDNAVIPLLMKKASDRSDLDIKIILRAELKNMRTHRKGGIVISGHYKMIAALAVVADKNDSKYIAYHQDADRHYDNVYKEIKAEFDKLNRFRCLAIVPKEMIESWLLADISAINALGTVPIDQSPNPETLWGEKNNPCSNYPKNYLRQILEKLGLEDNRDTFANIAKNADIEVLKRRCPKSFGQFYTDIQSFITEENTP